MLRRRLFSAFVLLAFVFGCIGLDLRVPLGGNPGWWMVPVYSVLVLGTVWEMAQLIAIRWPLDPKRVLVGASVAAIFPMFPMFYSTACNTPYPANCPVGSFGWIVIGNLFSSLLLGIDAMRRFTRASLQRDSEVLTPEDVALSWLLSVSIIAYVVTPMSVWWIMRHHGSSSQGMANLVGIVLITKMADTGAYFFGKAFGKTKLSPVISPGKTIEGLLGGMFVASIASVLYFRLCMGWLGVHLEGSTYWGPVVLAVLLTLGGVVGDLMESMVKRAVCEKDSGNQLPGLGGIWDVTDSLIPAAVLGYLGVLGRLN